MYQNLERIVFTFGDSAPLEFSVSIELKLSFLKFSPFISFLLEALCVWIPES